MQPSPGNADPPPDVEGGRPRRNIELKARLADLAHARDRAGQLATRRLGTEHQLDTYFHVPHGRLKIREIDGLAAELVWYDRPDAAGPKASDYRLVPVGNPHSLKLALTAALGVRAVVDKRREIFLIDNVRVHLDIVKQLGSFLEFEAVLAPGADDARGFGQVDELMGRFGIAPGDLVTGSYGELILAAGGG
jgi:predicted adenylyl cyclase CyaB